MTRARARCLLYLIGVCAFAPLMALGQADPYGVIYRPPEADYRVLQTEHFELIFQEGLEDEAREAAAILEANLPPTQLLVGSRRRLRMPVVLNRFNDRANGYVTPFPFKQEVEGVALRGNVLSPRYTSWLQAVLPHELVHAAHANRGTGWGIGALIRPFSPDLARALNFGVPAGVSEGIAVYGEGLVAPGVGRLPFALFAMRFRAAMLAGDGWSLAQALEASAYTRPRSRHYIGGGFFTQYLVEGAHADFFDRALDLHYRLPFFGFGAELWHATGQPPWRLGRAWRAAVRAEEAERLDHLREVYGPLTEPTIVATGLGLEHRRPRWLDGGTLLAYAEGYDLRPGFYRFDAATGARTTVGYEDVTEDYFYSLTSDGGVLFSRYVPDAFASVQALADVFRLDLATGETQRLTRGARVTAPAAGLDAVWALQNDGQFNRWVALAADGAPTVVADFARGDFRALLPSPDGETVVALLNVRGHQGLFRLTPDAEAVGGARVEPWVLFEAGAVYDAAWSVDGRHLTFSADPHGVANVYVLDVEADEVRRLTNARFGAFEGVLSPEGDRLAFVHYRHERYDLALVPVALAAAPVLPAEAWRWGQDRPWTEWLTTPLETAYDDAPTEPYRAWRRLRPRTLYPVVEAPEVESVGVDADLDTDLGWRVGAGLAGADPLERWAYGTEAYVQHGRLWGEAMLLSGRFLLRPSVRAYVRPSAVTVRAQDGSLAEVGREERGASAAVRLPVTFRRDVFVSSATFFLRGAYEQERLFSDAGTVRDFQGRVTLTPLAQLALRLQQNRRDLIPNTGLMVAAQAELDAWAEGGGVRREGMLAQASLYLPVLQSVNGGLRLYGRLLTQNRAGVFSTGRFVPRGTDGELFLDAGTFAAAGAEVIQPLRFVDDGLLILPVYLEALYAYGFAEGLTHLGRTRPVADGEAVRSAGAFGGGLGVQFRLFSNLRFDARIGAAYRTPDRRWSTIWR